jgi:hypothetical protein
MGLEAWRTGNGGALPPVRDPAAVAGVLAATHAAAGRLGLEGPYGSPFVLAGGSDGACCTLGSDEGMVPASPPSFLIINAVYMFFRSMRRRS